MIYLDHNSTTTIDPEVADLIAECYRQGFVNPASQHRAGQKARQMLEKNRSRIVEILGGVHTGMQTDTLILTSGGTEANNLALNGLIEGDVSFPPRLLVSSVEHPSVLAMAQQMALSGTEVEFIPVDRWGVVLLPRLRDLLKRPASLVSVMMANNETGVIQPMSEISAICRESGVRLHTDAVQAVGKMAVNFRDLDVDALTLTAHKLHGPRGIGALLVRHGVTIQPQLFGGFQQMALRPGTEDVALTAGFCRALERFVERGPESLERIRSMRDWMQNEILTHGSHVVINGWDAHRSIDRVPHTLNIAFTKVDRQALLLAADMAGLAISTGSACASGSSEPSHVLVAMGADSDVIQGSIRISLGATTTEEEIEIAARRIIKLSNDLGGSK